jgi:hypothetical protein
MAEISPAAPAPTTSTFFFFEACCPAPLKSGSDIAFGYLNAENSKIIVSLKL